MHRPVPTASIFILLLFSLSLSFSSSPGFAANIKYGYDLRQRLISAEYADGAKIIYSYDTLGNRLTETVTGPTNTTYEDAEDGNTLGWDIYDNDPVGATITNVVDDQREGRVIEFSGEGTANGYHLRSANATYWNDSRFKVIEWSSRYDQNFTVYIAVQTTNGFRYLYYTPADTDNLGTDTYVHHGLGSTVKDGAWHTIVRDLAYDLRDAQPDNELIAVLGFLIRGSGKVDDIKTLAALPADLDSDGDQIVDVDELGIYGTDPYSADSDGDGIGDGEELSYWGTNWNSDPDGDGFINLLDIDADNDGFADGQELAQGGDPADAALYPSKALYEDGEDAAVLGWDIYDNDPAGAIIVNVYDDTRASRVIEFSGSGTANGYRLRNIDGSYWNDVNFEVIQWSMRYNENYTLYIAVQTRDGFRYLYYTAEEVDRLGTDTYIHHGLGAYTKDGNWHTLVRDLAYDLKEAQPKNELTAVLGFLIRGNGRVDDIMTLAAIPGDLDSDGDTLTDREEISTYRTHPYIADTDSDGLFDGEELTFWGDDWNSDPDGDGRINILDPDADNDNFADGVEVNQGTDPANAASFPTSAVYEDAEDGDILGWDIYDNDPAGATIANVYDQDRGNQVVELTGTGTANGYRLRNKELTYWYDANFKTIEWSMKYSESFTVYIAVQTKNGFRYLYYTPAATNGLGADTYIHHGLGGGITDGSWHTLSRNLEADLKEAQPENELESVLGFLIRGSGRVDDIKMK